MPRQRPLIGVSAESNTQPAWESFASAVHAAGGEPLLLTPESSGSLDPSNLPGVILTGGGDIQPSFYGEAERVAPRRLSRARDEFELLLCQKALQHSLPLLAICRGMQVLVVAAGGKLLQHIPDDLPGALVHDAPSPGDALGHLVEIRANSRLAGFLGEGPCFVNTSHHQAPSRLGTGLAACAFSTDGLIEAVEKPSAPFLIGIEWHPERMWACCPIQRRLIEGLVEAAGRRVQA
ncbi:MAG: gamma-glutamyl-gamma-aminobutyrate hydrolase family protein [Armatimonadetes bacterium]|nr:gamma-glutamyl-gamma-aminobutyrate hydrolase family protein [Armatimonadota bacterium]NIM24629.1 gamma-glutamyl-gamma-aminobutyrate hydrolase family protein [Armatimonadota bacterium]NIM68508.1 gamma-glutamyl-gamma-aminobutyrate hydrolase family protein [Armatimonadota bacterium]NIM76890.1 gamma-glutamyl-gamma-aminobutyrate hydrolase family protein [Armatimonadota bacterium]NIN06702.1 gamma-glutamyl-gamma-aminobutyrate hydrolase family protein [Armatimonadota bacterium]